MLKCCFTAHCKIPELYEHGSTGGVATGLAYHMLKTGYVQGVLVSRRYETYIATDLKQLVESCGSIYEDYKYYKPVHNRENLAQIGKPCDINRHFKFSISLFCSTIFTRQNNPLTKKGLRKLSSSRRYLTSLMNKPPCCRKCQDHIGVNADICVGDSQVDPKVNHVIVRTHQGLNIWNQANMNIIQSQPISFKEVRDKQPYLWKGGKFKWIMQKLRKSG